MKRELRKDIIEYLKKDKKSYSPEVDDYLIDILVENVEYAKLMQQNLADTGIIVEIPNGNGIITTKENPAFGTYVKCLNNINQCAKQLGLNRADRLRLKMIEEQEKDEFDSDFE